MRIRPCVLALALLAPSLAIAGETGGGGKGNGGGGRLGQVSGGLRGGGQNNPPTPPPQPPRGGGGSAGNGTDRLIYAPIVVASAAPIVVLDDRQMVRRVRSESKPGGTAKIEAYVAGQKVVESQGAWHVELGIRDRLFALRVSVNRYYEEQPDNSTLTLTMPALIGGVRVDDHRGPTHVFLELGMVNAKTHNDPVMDSSLTGGLAGIRLEHRLTRETSLVGEIHEMFFESSVRAHSGRVGIRYNMLQASFRALDFNVGPALYGPEIGLQF
jgi:hypothetical protein